MDQRSPTASLVSTRANTSGDEGGRSLAKMASRDLEAALHLLAERAQYLTGATGAAIALRQGERDAMLCRACAGLGAPELGALLSTQSGFSGESLRSRRVQRCDDAQNDRRVDGGACRDLGIGSFVVAPIINGEQAIGVFELFSDKVRAFEESHVTALRRLTRLVAVAVQFAVAAQASLDQLAPGEPDSPSPIAAANDVEAQDDRGFEPALPDVSREIPSPAAAVTEARATLSQAQEAESVESGRANSVPAPQKGLFWSAAQTRTRPTGAESAVVKASVPPTLRNLRKCQACGFPVSQDRKLCVECEEKQWRGQRLPMKIGNRSSNH